MKGLGRMTFVMEQANKSTLTRTCMKVVGNATRLVLCTVYTVTLGTVV